MKETTSMNTDTVSLVDIRDVSVDKNLTREERVAEFVRQIKGKPEGCIACGKICPPPAVDFIRVALGKPGDKCFVV